MPNVTSMSQMALLAVQPQHVNSKSDFIQQVLEIVRHQRPVPSWVILVMERMLPRLGKMSFLDGEINGGNFIAEQDINHTKK